MSEEKKETQEVSVEDQLKSLAVRIGKLEVHMFNSSLNLLKSYGVKFDGPTTEESTEESTEEKEA